MLAIVQDSYGSADVLQLREIPAPLRSETARCSCGSGRPPSTRTSGTS